LRDEAKPFDRLINPAAENRGAQRLFKAAFPSEETKISYDHMAKSIAAFERTLVTRDRFDDFLRGSDTSLTELERTRLKTFMAVGCATCHKGPLLGGNTYQKLGLIPAPGTSLLYSRLSRFF
jgi:cytochrome c peroxidase